MNYEGTMVKMEARNIAENYNYEKEFDADEAMAVKSGKWWMVIIGGRPPQKHAPDKVRGMKKG